MAITRARVKGPIRAGDDEGLELDVFPAIFPLAGKTVVVAGDGPAADAKARLFDGSPATLRRIAAAQAASVETYRGARLAFIALPSQAEAATAAAAARTAGALVNVVDRPELCDFTTPALVDRGSVVGAIASGGRAPVLVAELRQAWEAQWPEGLGRVAMLLDSLKADARRAAPEASARRALLRSIVRGPAAAAALVGRMVEAEALARVSLAGLPLPPRLVLALAPAESDLMSLRLLRRLSEADVVVADIDVHPELLAYARRDAELHRVALEEAWSPTFPSGAALVVRLATDLDRLDVAPSADFRIERLV